MPPRMTSTPNLLDHALAYAAAGWHVFPCSPGGKVPMIDNGHLAATTDPEQIRRWWGAVPTANIGVSLEPSQLVVLDVDVAAGKLGRESLAELEREIGELPPSLAQRTGRGGAHVVYKRPANVEPRRVIKFRPGLDLLGKGYILAQPSQLYGQALEGAIDGATGFYAWANPSAPIAELPPSLANAGHKPAAVALEASGNSAPIVTGDRNNALFRLGCSLRDTGIDERALILALMATNAERMSPPLEEAEVLQVAASVMQRVQPRRDVAGNAAFADGLRSMLAAPLEVLGKAQADMRERQQAPEQNAKGFTLAGEVALRNNPPVRRYATGFAELDALIGGGVSTRQLLALLGKPGAGKSAFLITLIEHIEAVIPALYVSTELESDEIAARLAAPIIGCPWKAILEDAHDGPLRKRMREVLASKRIAIIGCDEIPVDGNAALEIVAKTILAMRAEFGISPLTVVDYLQDLARGGEDAAGVRFKVGGAARLLRIMSQILDCPMVAVSSVGRTSYGTAANALRAADDPTVYLSSAKESGDVDYAAATVLYLDVADDTGEEWRPGRVAAAKARHGRTGFAGVRFHGATGRWQPDSAAVTVMSQEAQGGAKADRKNAEDDTTVINKVRTLSAAGDAALLAPSALREVCGINKGRAEKAIARCLGDARLVLREVERTDRFHKVRRVSVVDLAGSTPQPAPAANPVPNPDPILAKIIGMARGPAA